MLRSATFIAMLLCSSGDLDILIVELHKQKNRSKIIIDGDSYGTYIFLFCSMFNAFTFWWYGRRSKTLIDPYMLGRRCAEHALWGLTEWTVENDDGVNEKALRAYLKKVMMLQKRSDRELFLKGLIERLNSWKIDGPITDGSGRVYDLTKYQQGKVALLKFLGIDIFNLFLRALDYLPWGGRSGDIFASEDGAIGRDVLFSGMYLPLQKTYGMMRACATASIKACHEVGLPCFETEMQVVLRTLSYDFKLHEDSISYATMLVLELIYGHFGKNVTSFLCLAGLFARYNKSNALQWP